MREDPVGALRDEWRPVHHPVAVGPLAALDQRHHPWTRGHHVGLIGDDEVVGRPRDREVLKVDLVVADKDRPREATVSHSHAPDVPVFVPSLAAVQILGLGLQVGRCRGMVHSKNNRKKQ